MKIILYITILYKILCLYIYPEEKEHIKYEIKKQQGCK